MAVQEECLKRKGSQDHDALHCYLPFRKVLREELRVDNPLDNLVRDIPPTMIVTFVGSTFDLKSVFVGPCDLGSEPIERAYSQIGMTR